MKLHTHSLVCPHCTIRVAYKNDTCPMCGHDIRKAKKMLLIRYILLSLCYIAALLLLAFVIAQILPRL